MKIGRFMLGLGYTFMSCLCIWGLYTLIEESTNISEDIFYILLFGGATLLLAFAAYCSFKQSISEDNYTEVDISVNDMLIQKNNDELLTKQKSETINEQK